MESKNNVSSILLFIELTDLLVNVNAKVCLKVLSEGSSNKIFKYSCTRLYVFPEPADAFIILK